MAASHCVESSWWPGARSMCGRRTEPRCARRGADTVEADTVGARDFLRDLCHRLVARLVVLDRQGACRTEERNA